MHSRAAWTGAEFKAIGKGEQKPSNQDCRKLNPYPKPLNTRSQKCPVSCGQSIGCFVAAESGPFYRARERPAKALYSGPLNSRLVKTVHNKYKQMTLPTTWRKAERAKVKMNQSEKFMICWSRVNCSMRLKRPAWTFLVELLQVRVSKYFTS